MLSGSRLSFIAVPRDCGHQKPGDDPAADAARRGRGARRLLLARRGGRGFRIRAGEGERVAGVSGASGPCARGPSPCHGETDLLFPCPAAEQLPSAAAVQSAAGQSLSRPAPGAGRAPGFPGSRPPAAVHCG